MKRKTTAIENRELELFTEFTSPLLQLLSTEEDDIILGSLGDRSLIGDIQKIIGIKEEHSELSRG